MKKRKIIYISGTRADYGLMRNTLFSIRKHPQLEIEIIATGMHLMTEFGKTIKEIEKDNFRIHKIKALYNKDNKESMTKFIGEFIFKLTEKIKSINPDIILITGDRAEALGAAVVGAYLTIPVAHIHGGDITTTIDEIARHTITKLSHIHLPASEKAKERIKKMGEAPKRIFEVGAPGLDDIFNKKLSTKKKIANKYSLKKDSPVLLTLQHPVTSEIEECGKQIKETMEAIKELGYQTIVVYPNADAGGRKIIKVIEKYKKYPFIQIYKNLPRIDFLSLMNLASVIVGNSSSGIIEAPSLNLPAVNIGIRQKGREKTNNIIEVDYNKKQIKKAIKKAVFSKKFKEKLKKSKNPYGSGKTGLKVANILSKIEIDKKLLYKKTIY